MAKEIGIYFGGLHPTIAAQLKKQKFEFSTEKAKIFETNRVSITRLLFAYILTDSECKKAYQRLFNQIQKHVNQNNKTP